MSMRELVMDHLGRVMQSPPVISWVPSGVLRNFQTGDCRNPPADGGAVEDEQDGKYI